MIFSLTAEAIKNNIRLNATIEEAYMTLIPMPQKLTAKSGSFRIDKDTAILLDISCGYADFEAALELRGEIERMSGVRPDILKTASGYKNNYIFLKINAEETGMPSVYKLEVGKEAVRLTGKDSCGLFYGIQTLRQLVRNGANNISCLEIEDYPAFENRGFYHDITRGKVPTLETLKELADRLSFYKLNQLQLYIEHSFAFRKHSELWVDTDPVTAEEILVLDEYCRKRNIELVPSLSTFGHLYHALISKSFRRLNEYEEIPVQQYILKDRMQHYTLDVSNPESLEFVYAMIDEFLPLFTSDKFNICCDETFDLGRGKNRKLLEDAGTGRLYTYFVNNVIKHVKTYKKTVMMWGDIILKHPETVENLPRDVIILNWDYSTNPPEKAVRAFAEAGLSQYVCPGVHGWNRLVNSLDDAEKNIGIFVEKAAKYNVKGILNTDWGDFGHVNLLSGSVPGAVFGAGLSWNPSDMGKPTDEEISRIEYGDGSGKLVAVLRQLSRQAVMDWETAVLWYYTVCGMSADLYGYKSIHLAKMLESTEENVKASYGRILELRGEISALYGSVYPEKRSDIREFLVSADGLALFQALLLVIKKKFLGQTATGLIFDACELAAGLEYWFADYKSVWRARNKESELFRIKEVVMGICSLLRTDGDGSCPHNTRAR